MTLPDVNEELVLRVLGKLGQVKQFQHQNSTYLVKTMHMYTQAC